MPFDVIEKSIDSEPHYICSPSNDDASLFEVDIYIHNSVRIIADIMPQKHAGGLLYEMQQATTEQINMFFEYWDALKNYGAKVQFLINNTSVKEANDWNKQWRMFNARVTKIPLTDDNDDCDNFEVITTWAKHCFCWIFCLLNISDVPSYDIVSEPFELRTLGKLEGNIYQVTTNRYERNTINRELCLARKGYKCAICGFDFKERYGKVGKNFIEVHHVVPVSQLGPNYRINVDTDLIPVCANCHAMLHRKDPPYTPSELTQIVKTTKETKTFSSVTSNSSDGILMVMMEMFANKSSNFLSTGKIAIALKDTSDGKLISDNLNNIHYILFHTRKDEGQHLYKVKGTCAIVDESTLDNSIYKNMKTSSTYILVNFESQEELDSSMLHSSKRGYIGKTTRYDSQYADYNDLVNS